LQRRQVDGDRVYVSGMTADPLLPLDKLGDVQEQTRQALARIDALLAQAGTRKSNLLTAQVYLPEMNNFFSHNEAWNEWVDPNGLPSRACLLSPQLAAPGLLVEIMVTAALKA
jgi:enamine deaminase RidA (YjgF/YER057c/UK114 family)